MDENEKEEHAIRRGYGFFVSGPSGPRPAGAVPGKRVQIAALSREIRDREN